MSQPNEVTVVQETSFTLSLDQFTYTAGQGNTPAQLTANLIFRSTVNPPVVLQYTSLQRFDLLITNDAGTVVYQWSAGQMFPQMAQNFTINGTVSWTVVVTLADTTGTPLPPGHYIAQAYLPVLPGSLARICYGAMMQFTIQ